MTPSEIDAQIASLRAVLDGLIAGEHVTSIKEGDRSMEMRPASEAELRRRISELEAMRAGVPLRVQSRRCVF